MKKKVALFISTLNSGGAERVVSHLSSILSTDYTIYVVLFENTYMEYEIEGQMYNLDVPAMSGTMFTKILLLQKRITRLKRFIKQEKIDCVISFLDSPNFVNLLAYVKDCKKVISIRNYSQKENSQDKLGIWTNRVMKYLYRKADSIVTVSKLLERSFVQSYGMPQDKVKTIYNPYNFHDIYVKSNECLSDEETAFWGSNFVFANVGRLTYQKGIWHLIKAFSKVRTHCTNARLVIIGEDRTDGKLEKLIEDLGISDSVLLTGRTRNPYKYMSNAHCYVLSSLFEGFPNAMVEAMACQCSIIATDCKSGPREILYEIPELDVSIDDNTLADYGILIPELEPEENWDASTYTEGEKRMECAMVEMLTNTEQCNDLARKAYTRSLHFSMDKCRELYSIILNN